MQITSAQFDSEMLYTTEWVAPHHDHLNFVPPPNGWVKTNAGAIVDRAMSQRGLTIYDVAIQVSGTRLLVSGPRRFEPTTASLSIKRPCRASVEDLNVLLDLARSNLAREKMMLAAGWTRDAPEPAWAQLTTPLAEHVLGLEGYRSYDLWSLPVECSDLYGRIEASDHPTGDARDALLGVQALRVGPLLKLEGSFGTGVRFAQGCSTRVVMPHAGRHTQAAMAKKRPVVQDFGFVGSGPVARYLSRRPVRSVLHRDLVISDTRLLEIEMPIITMEEIPEAALRAIGVSAPPNARRFPYWAVASLVTPGGDRAPPMKLR